MNSRMLRNSICSSMLSGARPATTDNDASIQGQNKFQVIYIIQRDHDGPVIHCPVQLPMLKCSVLECIAGCGLIPN